MTRFGLSEHILNQIIGVLSGSPKVESACIFGSRGRGDFRNGSDIDLAVFAPRMTFGEFAHLNTVLLELPIAFAMDVVHVDTVSDVALRDCILRDGVAILPEKAAA
jgi:predicted nucleotidyltransferase